MSFGVSVGDLLQIAHFAETTWRRCHDAGKEFREASHELSSLYLALSNVQRDAEDPTSAYSQSNFDQQRDLLQTVVYLREVLQELDALLKRYEGCGTRQRSTWQSLKFGRAPLAEIRSKILVHLGALNTLRSSLSGGVLGKIERKLDDLAADLRQGKRAPTVLSTYEEADADIWEVLKKELLNDGVTSSDIERHKDSIKTYIKTLIESGALDDVESFESSSTITGPSGSRQHQATCEDEATYSREDESYTVPLDVSTSLHPPSESNHTGHEEQLHEAPQSSIPASCDKCHTASCHCSARTPSEEELYLTLILLGKADLVKICSSCNRIHCTCKASQGHDQDAASLHSMHSATDVSSNEPPASSSTSRLSYHSLDQDATASGYITASTEPELDFHDEADFKSSEADHNLRMNAQITQSDVELRTNIKTRSSQLRLHNISGRQVCSICFGSERTCDCSQRRISLWKQRIERYIYPVYMFWKIEPFLDKQKRWLHVLRYLTRALSTDLPEDFPPSMSPKRYAEIIETVPIWLFQLPIQPQFLIEHTHKTYNGGWTRSFNPNVVGELLYTNMLAGPDERLHFRFPPILNQYSTFDLPPGWRAVTTKGGRVYYQHMSTGFSMYQHPSNSSCVNQLSGSPAEPKKDVDGVSASLGIQGKWALDDPDAPCLLSEKFFRLKEQRLEANEARLEQLHLFGRDLPRGQRRRVWMPVFAEVHFAYGAEEACDICESKKASKELEYLLYWRLYNTFDDT